MNNAPDHPEPYSLRGNVKLLQTRLRQAETLASVAITQAALGTWNRNLTTGHFEVSDRLREIFGLALDTPISYEEILSRIQADYLPLVLALIRQSLAANDDHDIEFPLNVPGKRNPVWVRATGKVMTVPESKESYFIGTVMDLTPQRDLMLVKQGFVQSITEELKTPLIALSAYLQVLERKLEPQAGLPGREMLQKMQVQVEKINAAIAALKNQKL